MPENPHFMPSNKLMNADEIVQLATLFVKLGVNKIRLTGGEPLVRKDAHEIMRSLSKLPIELTLTTNGYFIDKYIEALQECGIKSLNVSLDTLRADRFFLMTKRQAFNKVWRNILTLIELGIHVKLNVVMMKGINDDELFDFIRLTKEHDIHVRFIEFMPFDGNSWQWDKVIPYHQLLKKIEYEYSLMKLSDHASDTAKKYKLYDSLGTFAFISTMSEPFCSGCNRLRLTADGKLKNCLFSCKETDLLTALRNKECVEELIFKTLEEKKKETGGQLLQHFEKINTAELINRSMVSIGG